MSVPEAVVIDIPPTPPLAEVIVVPETVPGAADHIQEELEDLGYTITPKIERALTFLREHSYGGRIRTRKNKRVNKKSKKSKKTRGRK
jgi:hypothetical protein